MAFPGIPSVAILLVAGAANFAKRLERGIPSGGIRVGVAQQRAELAGGFLGLRKLRAIVFREYGWVSAAQLHN